MSAPLPNRELMGKIHRLTSQLLSQLEVYGELVPKRKLEREQSREGHSLALWAERFFRDASERARNVKEMLEVTPEEEAYWRQFDDSPESNN